tara:strand:+ start:217 stop:882 length:666 start_codon:yes stop_codon:yes gene_type:complete
MKVKIKKDGKTETYNIIDSWSDVTMESWMQLIKAKDLGKAEDAKTSILALSDIPDTLINQLSLKDVAILMETMGKLQSEQEVLLKKVIYIDGQEYGFHPNLDDITIGEYADIETMIKSGLEDNLPELMAVLFRPIVDRKGEAYKIEAYDGDITIRAEVMKKMSSEQVQGALVFFWNFVQELSSSMQSYLMNPIIKEMEEAVKVSAKNGDGLESSIASVTKT